jgi:hypothetical protein
LRRQSVQRERRQLRQLQQMDLIVGGEIGVQSEAMIALFSGREADALGGRVVILQKIPLLGEKKVAS